MHQLLVADGRAQIGEQPEVFAQPEDGLFGAQRSFELVVFPVADCTEQDRVGLLGQRQGGVGQRMALGVVGCATYQCGFHLE